SGAKGRILLAKPFLTGVYLPDGTYTGNVAEDLQYEGWLYALVVNSNGTLDGLYETKDNGDNWTYVRIPAFQINPLFPNAPSVQIPTNDTSLVDYDPLSGDFYVGQGNYDSGLAIDPNNPNIIYIGGTIGGNPVSSNGPNWGLIRVDTSTVADPHAVFLGQ